MNFQETVEKVEQSASENINVSADDYLKDGLLHCGKCHTPKQARLEINGKIRTPMCLCKCEQERKEALEEQMQKKEALEKVRRLKRMGFPDSEMEKWTFEHDDCSNKKISMIAQNYVSHFDQMKKQGKGMLFYGAVGTGKTFISACIANALIERGHPCLVTNFARLTNTLSGMYEGKQEYLDSLNKFDLIVIDDLASERDTEYMGEIVQNIIDSRYRSGKPLIITTNLTGQELKNPTEIRKQRIYSRLLEMCVPVEVTGKDRRKEKLKADYKEMEEVLGL